MHFGSVCCLFQQKAGEARGKKGGEKELKREKGRKKNNTRMLVRAFPSAFSFCFGRCKRGKRQREFPGGLFVVRGVCVFLFDSRLLRVRDRPRGASLRDLWRGSRGEYLGWGNPLSFLLFHPFSIFFPFTNIFFPEQHLAPATDRCGAGLRGFGDPLVRVSRGVWVPQSVGGSCGCLCSGTASVPWVLAPAPFPERCGNTVMKERAENWGDKLQRCQAPIGRREFRQRTRFLGD